MASPVCEDPISGVLASPRMPSPLFDSSEQALLRACLPHTSHPEPIKPVCLAAAMSTGRVLKCCSNAPPGKLTPQRFTSLFRAPVSYFVALAQTTGVCLITSGAAQPLCINWGMNNKTPGRNIASRPRFKGKFPKNCSNPLLMLSI